MRKMSNISVMIIHNGSDFSHTAFCVWGCQKAQLRRLWLFSFVAKKKKKKERGQRIVSAGAAVSSI